MNKKELVFALMMSLLFSFSESLLFAADPGDTQNLNEFYEQNGDCYLLIGNSKSESKSGVYQLNNLTNGVVKKLYSPGNAYGITAGLRLDDIGKPEKSLYTFIAKDRTSKSAKGRITTRPMLTSWSYGTWQSNNNSTPNNVAPHIVHRYHTLPNDASTGVGNHTNGYGLYKFDYKCIPCSIKPVADGVDDDGRTVYRYKIGEEWYHSWDYPAYSRYTYCTKGTWSRFANTGYTDIWMNDDAATRNANDPDWYWTSTRYGGWVHYVAKEDITEQRDKLYLQTWIVDHGFNGANKYITDVVVGASSSLSLKGECIDGCISDRNNISLPGEPAPHLDTAYSAQTQASYIYTRDRGSDDGTINGLQSAKGDIIVGNEDTMTTKFVGISSRTDTGNFVYLLGADVINQWMKDCKCPDTMLIKDPEDLADIAVSDQWWQNGGIVYAYDKAKKKVYCFVRDEKLGKSDPPTEISADLGGERLPDRIGADGFGALYLLKTDFKPDTNNPKVYFAGKGKNEDYMVTICGYDRGRPKFMAWYKQDIVKSVYKKPYGSDAAPERLAKDVIIDTNIYTREYQTPSDTPYDPEKIYTTGVFEQYVVNDLSGDYRSELAVINCPTPPRPDHLNSVCDNNGPMVYNSKTHTYVKASKRDDGYYPSDTLYYFMVENSPIFDSNLVNIGNTDVDIDGDGKTGRFPNTVKKSSLNYYWQIRRIVDRDGKKVNEYATENQVLDDGAGGHIVKGNEILAFPSLLDKGTYKVGVKVTYRYYDYSKLPVGALSSRKEECLTGTITAGAPEPAAGHPEDAGFSWETINFMPVEPPPSIDGDGVIMTSISDGDESGYLPGDGCGFPCSNKHPQCDNTEYRMNNPATPTFILDGYSLCKSVESDGTSCKADYKSENNISWGIKLRENTYNKMTKKLDRIAILCGEPPDPKEPKMIEGSLQWLNHKPGYPKVNNMKVEWSSELKNGSKTIFKETVVKSTLIDSEPFKLTLNDIRKLFPVPSEPLCYTLKVRAESAYTYTFYDYGPRTVAGGRIIYDNHPVTNNILISIKATGLVCVTDNQKPGYMVYDAGIGAGTLIPGYALQYGAGKDYVKATTGETIAQTDGEKDLIFYVADNNPFANYAGAAECTGNDKYHFNKNALTKTRLKVSHNKANRKAFLYNQNCSKRVGNSGSTNTTPEAVNSSSIVYNKLITAEPAAAGLTPSELVSFTKYTFKGKQLKKFTSDTDDAICFDYASNKASGYENLKFGIRWQETCYSTSNPLEVSEKDMTNIASFSLGSIVVVDNDRPNLFITAKQEKFTDKAFTLPDISLKKPSGKDYNGGWFPTIISTTPPAANYDRQGPEVWNLTGDPRSSFSNIYLNGASAANLSKEFFEGEFALLADVPVIFEVASATDNAGGEITYKEIKIMKFGKGGSASKYKDCTVVDNKKILCVFRDKDVTKYYVEATVADNARQYPAKAADDATSASLSKDWTDENCGINTRTIRAYFTVIPSRLDYRVLERDIRH